MSNLYTYAGKPFATGNTSLFLFENCNIVTEKSIELNKIKLTYVFVLHLDLHPVLSDVWSIIHELVVVVIKFPFVI